MNFSLIRRCLVTGFLSLVVALTQFGCTNSPDDAVVGIYTYDANRSKFPEAPGMPEIGKRVREMAILGKIKLLSDHTFVITGAQAVEGTWKRDGGEVLLVPKPGSTSRLLRVEKGTRAKLRNGGLEFSQETPFGPVVIRLKKTG